MRGLKLVMKSTPYASFTCARVEGVGLANVKPYASFACACVEGVELTTVRGCLRVGQRRLREQRLHSAKRGWALWEQLRCARPHEAVR